MSGSVELLVGTRHKGESDKAVAACNDYLRMGFDRSVTTLHTNYTHTSPENAPSKSLRWLKEWSRKYGWVERASLYDAKWEREKNRINEAERRRVFAQGVALDFERVKTLAQIGGMLADDLIENGVYTTDVKLAANGDEVEIEVINEAAIRQLRGIYDDIAKETGGRSKKVQLVTWRDKVVDALRRGKVQPNEIQQRLGDELAQQLFAEAGIVAK